MSRTNGLLLIWKTKSSDAMSFPSAAPSLVFEPQVFVFGNSMILFPSSITGTGLEHVPVCAFAPKAASTNCNATKQLLQVQGLDRLSLANMVDARKCLMQAIPLNLQLGIKYFQAPGFVYAKGLKHIGRGESGCMLVDIGAALHMRALQLQVVRKPLAPLLISSHVD
mmetsp:Transcript_27544/g.70972  ORF Transcript_27544/g.70972 Transcript_27544/m.70972 type:complete len:167 (+) Transcript_27544:529-1029(+)